MLIDAKEEAQTVMGRILNAIYAFAKSNKTLSIEQRDSNCKLVKSLVRQPGDVTWEQEKTSRVATLSSESFAKSPIHR